MSKFNLEIPVDLLKAKPELKISKRLPWITQKLYSRRLEHADEHTLHTRTCSVFTCNDTGIERNATQRSQSKWKTKKMRGFYRWENQSTFDKCEKIRGQRDRWVR